MTMSHFKPHFFESGEYILCTINRDWDPSRPSDCNIQEWDGTWDVNHLNVDHPPNNPASFWIEKGYEVYSMLSEGHWLQIVFSPAKGVEEMKRDVAAYKEEFKFSEFRIEDQKRFSGCISEGGFDDCHCAYCGSSN